MKKILLLGTLLLLMFSCTQTGLGPAIGGTVLLSFDDGVTPRSILPVQSMDISTYDIYGVFTSDPTETFEQLNVPITGNIVIIDLYSGDWTITVDGRNAAGDLIGTGSNTVTVTPTSQSQVDIAITPIVGQGTFNFDVTWSLAADTEIRALGTNVIPQLNSQLFPYGGLPVDLTFVYTMSSYLAEHDSLQDYGYYTLLTQFVGLEEVTPGVFVQSTVAGNAEVVRIATGDTTNGSYFYDDINTNPIGDIDIVISPELGDPLIIDLTPNVDGLEYTYGDTFTMDATTSSTTDLVDYTWYVNGAEYQTGPNLIYDTRDFPKPKNNQTFFSNISVIGFSNVGTRGGSTSVSITTVK